MFYKIGEVLIKIFVKSINSIVLFLEYILKCLEDKTSLMKGNTDERN
ncbi:hypothetical protein [Anaerococcus rubeinfantis]|nr:hypothetical protein [Anaerococcus rubeinfantis]